MSERDLRTVTPINENNDARCDGLVIRPRFMHHTGSFSRGEIKDCRQSVPDACESGVDEIRAVVR